MAKNWIIEKSCDPHNTAIKASVVDLRPCAEMAELMEAFMTEFGGIGEASDESSDDSSD